MGVIRLILALSVVLTHSGSFFGYCSIGGRLAVESFFIISGFYMGLVLTTKYGSESKWVFYRNRYLRLWPSYAIILVLALLLLPVTSSTYLGKDLVIPTESALHTMFSTASWFDQATVVLSNATLFLQDLALFVAYDTDAGRLFYSSDALAQTFPAINLQLVPQAWTISVEIWFYLLAPFIVARRTRTIVFICVLGVLLRACLMQAGLSHDPWSYRFFPTELPFFLFGVLAFRIFNQMPHLFESKLWQRVSLVMVYGVILAYPLMPGASHAKGIAFLIFFAIVLPYIFAATKDWRVDRKLGELSYSVYLNHVLIISVLRVCGMTTHDLGAPVVAGLSVGFATLVYLYVERPIDRMRQRAVNEERCLSIKQ